MSSAQQMIALIVFAWIGLACVIAAASVAVCEVLRLLIHVVKDYLEMWRRTA